MKPAAKKQLLQVWSKLGPNAKYILLRLGQGMAKGAKQYGDFPIRSWKKEAAEEALDMCVYLTAELELEPKKSKAGKKTSSRASR